MESSYALLGCLHQQACLTKSALNIIANAIVTQIIVSVIFSLEIAAINPFLLFLLNSKS